MDGAKTPSARAIRRERTWARKNGGVRKFLGIVEKKMFRGKGVGIVASTINSRVGTTNNCHYMHFPQLGSVHYGSWEFSDKRTDDEERRHEDFIAIMCYF